jgi:hypothetical protein
MKILLSLSIVLFLGACTITKRVHNPGWHVEWKSSKLKNHQTPNDQEIASDNLTKTDAHASSVSQTISLENNVGHTETASTQANQESSLDEVLSDQEQHQAEYVYSTNQKKPESRSEAQTAGDSPKTEPLGIASIFAGSTALIFFLNICFLLSDNGWNAIFGLGYPGLFLIVFALAVLGVIMGIVSYQRIQENPDLYKGKGKGRAIVGMYMSYFAGGLGLALLLGIGLFYLFETFFSW